MPVEFEFINNGIGILIIGKGDVSGQELLDTLGDIYKLEDKVKKLKYTIVDFTSALSMDVSSSEIQIMRERHKKASEISPDRAVALVSGKDLPYGISRMWEAIVDDIPWETYVFRSRAKADLWLKETVKNKFNIDITIAST